MEKNNKAITKSKQNDFSMISLDQKIQSLIKIPTPNGCIKEREGKGKRKFKYITVGYTVARLNEIFTPIGGDFEIVDQIIEPTEVVVKGKLTVKFPNGFEVSKHQYGTKERSVRGSISKKTGQAIEGVPLGDTLKAAGSDALKKCASMFGIGLDVYWNQLDNLSDPEKPKPPFEDGKGKAKQAKFKNLNSEQAFNLALAGIKKENNPIILREGRNNICASDLYVELDKNTLIEKIDEKLCQ